MRLFQLLNRKSMFAILHSNMKYLKSGLLHLTGRPYCKKSRSAKVKVGIINLILRNYLVDLYNGARSVIIWVRQTWDLANLILAKSFIVQAAWFWLIRKKNFFLFWSFEAEVFKCIPSISSVCMWRHVIQHNDTQHCDIHHNDTEQKAHSITTLNIQHNYTQDKGLIWDTQHKWHSA